MDCFKPSCSSSESDEADDARLHHFLRWFEREGGGYLHHNVEFASDSQNGIYLRIKANVTISSLQAMRHKTVVFAPHSMSMSCLNIQQRFSDVLARDTHFSGMLPSATSTPQNPILNVDTSEASELDARVLDAVALVLHTKQGERSWWKPYIDCLPAYAPNEEPGQLGNDAASLSILNAPIYWTEEERRWLRGTPVESFLTEKTRDWNALWDQYIQSRLAARIKSCGYEIERFELSAALGIFASRAFPGRLMDAIDETNETTVEVNKTQTTTISVGNAGEGQSDSHETDDQTYCKPHSVLYPGIDMINHSPHTKNYWQWDNKKFSLVLEDRPRPLAEIFNPYGPKSNDELLASYGFVLKDNPFDTITMKLRMPPLQETRADLPNGLRQGQSTTARSEEEEPASDGGLTASREPVMISPPHDFETGRFFIRHPETTDGQWGYFWSVGVTKAHSPLPNVEALGGIPISLAYTLFTLPGRQSTNETAFSAGSNASVLNRDVQSFLYSNFPQLVEVFTDLLDWLVMQEERLTDSSFYIESAGEQPVELSNTHYTRHTIALLYRQSLVRLLQANILAIQRRLDQAIGRNVEMITLAQMIYALESDGRQEFQEFNVQLRKALVELDIIDTSRWGQLHGKKEEEAIWIILLRVLMLIGVDVPADDAFIRRIFEVLGGSDTKALDRPMDFLSRLTGCPEMPALDDDPDYCEVVDEIKRITWQLEDDFPECGWWAEKNWREYRLSEFAFVFRQNATWIQPSPRKIQDLSESTAEPTDRHVLALFLLPRRESASAGEESPSRPSRT